MHAALQLTPVLAMGKSKDPFYVAAGLLVAWALLISMAVGMRRPSFPGSAAQQRAVMAVSVVLVIATVSMAVVVSGGEGSPASAAAATTTTNSEPATSASTQPATTTTPATTTESAPKATTGTPAPPSSPASGRATKVPLSAEAGGQLAYNTKTLTAKAGTVSIVMTNMSPLEHNVTVAEGGKVLGATPTFASGTKTLTLTLKPGKYTFYCSVPGHRQAGMEGTLTVTS